MVIHGRVEKGLIVPETGISLPDGTEVTIIVRPPAGSEAARMLPDEHARYLAGLASIDALPNESPGDRFRGADHDAAIYT